MKHTYYLYLVISDKYKINDTLLIFHRFISVIYQNKNGDILERIYLKYYLTSFGDLLHVGKGGDKINSFSE